MIRSLGNACFGHSLGYRNYEVANAATNIVPWGVIVGGEELHNNHHAFPSSAKFSVRPWEFDVGWLCVVLLRLLGLAKVKRVAPRPCVIGIGQPADPNAVYAVIHNRMHVLRAYATQVVAPVLEHELRRESQRVARASRKLLVRSPVLLDTVARCRLQQLLEAYPALRTVRECQEQLRLELASDAGHRLDHSSPLRGTLAFARPVEAAGTAVTLKIPHGA